MDTQCVSNGCPHMKSAGFRIRVDPNLRQAFIEACNESDVSAAHVLRSYMKHYIETFTSQKQGDLFHAEEVTKSNNLNKKN